MRGTSHTSIRRNNTAVDQHSNRNVSDLCAISVGNMAIHMTDGLSLSARYIAMPHLPRDHTTQPARQNLAATLQQEAVFGIVVCQRWRRWAATQLFCGHRLTVPAEDIIFIDENRLPPIAWLHGRNAQ